MRYQNSGMHELTVEVLAAGLCKIQIAYCPGNRIYAGNYTIVRLEKSYKMEWAEIKKAGVSRPVK
mgnify:CR=1 FL=1